MLKGKTVLLGVTGGIAAYKAAALASALVKQHAAVEVVMTENATQFVTPLTFEQLTGQPSQLLEAVALCAVGFLAIYGIELLARLIVKKEEK